MSNEYTKEKIIEHLCNEFERMMGRLRDESRWKYQVDYFYSNDLTRVIRAMLKTYLKPKRKKKGEVRVCDTLL